MQKSSIDPQELKKFASLSAHWWNKEGPLKTLHDINPARLSLIKSTLNLSGKQVLDLGCGGGILAEAMALEGASVCAIDAEKEAIAIAKEHAAKNHLQIEYQQTSIEAYEGASASFDCITCMELLEHVQDPAGIFKHCARLLKPEGFLLVSTINRNLKAYVTAVIGAEYILGLLPKQTHEYRKFIRPAELAAMGRSANLSMLSLHGLSYNPFNREAKVQQSSVAVNYFMVFSKSS